MNYTYIEGFQDIVFYSKSMEADKSHSSNFNINFLKPEISEAVRCNDKEKLKTIMNEIIGLFLECRPPRRQAVNACNNLYYFITSLVEEREKQGFPYVVDIVRQLNQMDSLTAVIEWLAWLRDETIKLLESNREESRLDKNVELAMRYVRDHCKEKISLSQVAASLNISQGHLSSTFRKQTGKKFSDYVAEVKIEKAKELIGTYQYMMYEIADLLGFDTQYYFSSVFKKITGYTPKEYETMTLNQPNS